jgi:hypothetical protein
VSPDGPRGLLDPPKRPAQAAKGKNLLLFGIAQDVAHGGEELTFPGGVNVSVAPTRGGRV